MENRRRLYVVALLSLIGLILSGILSRLYYVLKSGTGGFRSFCNLGESLNCDAVAASPYAELFSGIPLSSFAAGGFLATLILAFFGLSPAWRREAKRALLVMTGISVLFSLVYFFIMAFAVKTFCILCLGVDLIAILSFILVLSLKPEGFKEHKLDFSKWKTLMAVILGSVFIAIIALKALDPVKTKPSLVNETVRSVIHQQPLPVRTSGEVLSFGPEDAPVTIVEFSDMQCPYCKIGAQTLNLLMNRYPGKIRVVMKNFPLDPACNPGMRGGGHPAACEAAKAVVCANEQDQLQSVYERIFERQSELAPGVPTRIARELLADTSAFDTCMSTEETSQTVLRDLEEGIQLGVRSTPTFFINGRRMEGVAPVPVWDKIVQHFINEQ